MDLTHVLVSEQDGVIAITLHRPEKRNALNSRMLEELTHLLTHYANTAMRVLILTGSGEHFCAGGDLTEMLAMGQAAEKTNEANAMLLAHFLQQLYVFPKPTIVLAHGTIMGGGLGLVAASDITIAAEDTLFGLPEVKLGLTPSIVSPYVLAAIGERLARYYFLTGETFTAERAWQLGLVQQIVTREKLSTAGLLLADTLKKNSEGALTTVKELIQQVNCHEITPQLAEFTAKHLAKQRSTKTAQAGVQAFLAKRKSNG